MTVPLGLMWGLTMGCRGSSDEGDNSGRGGQSSEGASPGDVSGDSPAAPGGSGDEASRARAQRLLDLTRSAIAATENLQAAEAVDQWEQILAARPRDASAAINAMLASVLVVDEMTAAITNPSTDAETAASIRRQVAPAIDAARGAAKRARRVAGADAIARWAEVRVNLHEAALLPASMTRSIRRDTVNELAEMLGDSGATEGSEADVDANSGGVMIFGDMLIGTIEQLSDPLDGLPRSIAGTATDAIINLSDRHPDNLYFALVAARTAIENRREPAATLVRRTADLVDAIKPSVARNTRGIGKTPDELIDDLTGQIQAGQWDAASGNMSLWFNVLNGTQLVKTDRRRAGPHPLDLISMSGLRQIAGEVMRAEPTPADPVKLAFELQSVHDGGVVAAAAVDVDLDGRPELAAVDTRGMLRTLRLDGEAWVTDGKLQVAPETSGLVAGDLFIVDSSSRVRSRGNVAAQHNTFEHLIAFGPGGVQMIQIDGREEATDKLSLIEGETGLESIRDVIAVALGDLEADGDLDLVVSTDGGLRMFVNRGNRTFFEIELAEKFADDPPSAMAIGDLDRDLDLDLVTAHHGSGKVGIIENQLHLQFKTKYIENVEPVVGASAVTIEDVDGDVAWDVLIGGDDRLVVAMGNNQSAGVWTVDQTQSIDGDFSNFAVGDLDNDSYLEAITASQTVRLRGEMTAAESVLAADGDKADLVVVDLGSDGQTDVILGSPGGLRAAVNRTETDDHFATVRFKGIDDNVSGRVNHYAIGSVMEMRFGPHYRARIVRSPATHFGLANYQSADLRAILPNGLTQVSRDLGADQLVQEEQKLKGSCPYLYAFNGDKIDFVTDCLWAAPLGLQVARDVVAADRPWEYLKVDGDAIAPRTDADGNRYYDLRMTEELWEIAYFDKIELTAVDHPIGTEIWTNEKVGPPSIATPTVFAFAADDRYRPTSATDTRGDDVTRQISHRDEDYVQGFDDRLRQGLCPPHHIDLTFDDVAMPSGDQGRVYLTLTGWILPTDTSLNIQIDQNPDLPSPTYPSLWTPDAKGNWTESIPFIGFPGGKTKTMVVDVTEHFDPTDPRLRIETSAQIYWDAAELVTQTISPEIVQQVCPLARATVDHRGFSAAIQSPGAPDRYDYQTVTTKPMWPPLSGPMTRLGDCTNLLTETDDNLVVIAGGDEIQLRFELPPGDPPTGWTRDYVLHNVGWDKDADLNTLAGQSTLPLPHQKMTEYPTATDPPPIPAHQNRHQNFRAFWSW